MVDTAAVGVVTVAVTVAVVVVTVVVMEVVTAGVALLKMPLKLVITPSKSRMLPMTWTSQSTAIVATEVVDEGVTEVDMAAVTRQVASSTTSM